MRRNDIARGGCGFLLEKCDEILLALAWYACHPLFLVVPLLVPLLELHGLMLQRSVLCVAVLILSGVPVRLLLLGNKAGPIPISLTCLNVKRLQCSGCAAQSADFRSDESRTGREK